MYKEKASDKVANYNVSSDNKIVTVWNNPRQFNFKFTVSFRYALTVLEDAQIC